jgi:malonate transporter
MLEVLSITFPIFAAIGVGYAAVAFRIFSPEDMRTLGRFVLNIALPPLLFAAVATRDLSEAIHPGFLVVMAAGGLATILVGYLIVWASGMGPARRAISIMGMSCPNSAFVGYPVLLLVLPDIAGPVLAMHFLLENFLLIPLGLFFLELSRPDKGRNLVLLILGIFRDVLTKPFVIGLLLGLVVSLLGLPVPAPVMRFADILAGSASAVALVVIGGTLYGLPVAGNRLLATEIALGKLLLHPALVAAAAMLLPMLGMAALPPDLWTAAVLSAAIPMFSVYVVLAQPYGHAGVASLALLGATAGSFVTLTALLALLSG